MLEEDLTPGEKLLLDRRRRKETLSKAASRWGATLAAYKGWETGAKGAPDVKLRGMTLPEQWVVLRLRAGLTQDQLAEKCGIWQTDVSKTEHGVKNFREIREFFGG